MAHMARLIIIGMLTSLASGHAVIINAQGLPNSPASTGFQTIKGNLRNCTNINPCQQDATLIRDAEIAANVVNECGRTELQGNIDIGENTENMLADNLVTQTKAGSNVVITIHQVNADGAGPFLCDLDPTSNGLGLTGQIPLKIVGPNVPGTNGLSVEKQKDFNITVEMPPDLKCVGGSSGNICTIRCRNNAQAGPFGGCFPVQQVDVAPSQNTPANIAAFKSLADVNALVDVNLKGFAAATKAVHAAGSPGALRALAATNAVLPEGLPNTGPPTRAVVPGPVLAPVPAASKVPLDDAGHEQRKRGDGSSGGGGGGGAGTGLFQRLRFRMPHAPIQGFSA